MRWRAGIRHFSDAHLDRLSIAQQNRTSNKNNRTGEKNISMQGKWFRVDVGGSYIGIKETMTEAIAIRDAARKALLVYSGKQETGI